MLWKEVQNVCMVGQQAQVFACVWEGAQQWDSTGRVKVDRCKVMGGGGLGCLPSRMAVLIKSMPKEPELLRMLLLALSGVVKSDNCLGWQLA